MNKTLYLIDGYAQVFRAYYAIRTPMHSPETGEPTNAVFGFTGMLFKLLSQYRPDYLAVAFDAPGRTFRDDLYEQYLQLHPSNVGLRPLPVEEIVPVEGGVGPEEGEVTVETPAGRYLEYKGNRQASPEDLGLQTLRILEVIEGFKIPILAKQGIEADDVIATVVQQILENPEYSDVHIRIISKDKDLEQLLCERVSIFDVHTEEVRAVAELQANKGITPEQVIDVMALTGDTVDNVPGVEGIGVKTAAQLVRQYGNIEGILANLDQIKGKRRENLERARPFLPISKAMVTLKRDADLGFTAQALLNSARVSGVDSDKLIPLFQTLGFHRFQAKAAEMANIKE